MFGVRFISMCVRRTGVAGWISIVPVARTSARPSGPCPKTPNLSTGRLITCLLLLIASVLPAQTTKATERQVLRGHIPRAVTELHLQPVGQLSGSTNLYLAIGLPLRNQEELNNLLQQIYDPASPNYHHYLTPEQFTERFGPDRTGLPGSHRFREGQRVDGDRPASRSRPVGCERGRWQISRGFSI